MINLDKKNAVKSLESDVLLISLCSLLIQALYYIIIGSFATSGSVYETSTWPPVVHDITCTGQEASLWNCSYSLSSSGQACGFDAAVVCQGRFQLWPFDNNIII